MCSAITYLQLVCGALLPIRWTGGPVGSGSAERGLALYVGYEPMSCAFFYGLFMDISLLREMKLTPVELGHAALRGYQLRVGARATLIPNPEATSYGMLIELSDTELSILYSPPGLSDYQPEHVVTHRLDDGSTQRAVCYNLPTEKLGAEFNSEYAKNLSALLIRLGFPPDYANEVKQDRS